MSLDESLLTGESVLTGAQGADTGGAASVASSDSALAVSPSTGNVLITQRIVATWGSAVYRVYAVDYDNGNDNNAGFATAASSSYADFQTAVASAGAVAKKTFQGLGTILPTVGNGRKVFIAIAARAAGASYLQQDGITVDTLDSFMGGRDGYAQILIWGTGTNTTAGATKFTGAVADLTYAGAIPATGTNAAGYNPAAAGVTTSTVPCLQVGGAAPALPAEPASPLGYSTRYDAATSTAALRNVCRGTQIISTTTTTDDTVSPQAVWPSAPAAADLFYLEMPGVACNGWGNAWGAGNGQTIICGVRALTLTNYTPGPGAVNKIIHMFCGIAGSTSFASSSTGIGAISAINPGVGSGTITRGSTLRLEGASLIQPNAVFPQMHSVVFVGNLLLEFEAGGVWDAGSVFGAGVTVQGGTCGSYVNNPVLGNVTAALQDRIIGPGSGAGLDVRGAIFNVKDAQITGSGAKPAIKLTGRCVLFLQGPSGSTGNTDVGLDLTGAQNSTITINGANPTVTGTAGDVRLSDGTIIAWATAAAGVVDANGNTICAAGNAPTKLVAVPNAAGTVTISNVAPAAVGPTIARWAKIPDGAGGFYTFPSFT